jgi:hypothetical protein
MFPHEAQAMMAKIIFLVFAMIIVLMGRVQAEITPNSSIYEVVTTNR